MRTLLAAVPLLLLGACGTGTGAEDVTASDPTPTATPTTLGPGATEYPYDDYAYTLRVTCFCPDAGEPIVVTVRHGLVVSTVYAKDGRGHQAGDPAPKGFGVTLDEVIAAAHDKTAATVRVKWPADQAYPSSVWVDRDEQMADEEVGYQVSNVIPE